MCDNTAPYTAQEVHLVTTKFKIVDKYTVEYKYITVLTQAQSSLKTQRENFKTTGPGIKPKTGLANKWKTIEIRQKNDMSRENEATEELGLDEQE